ncbi:winged helix-turn-helix domain-containing protein [Sphingomonas sp. QA11]|uniref:ArsR/SmtB family transcription factor n=1 Tax=Sphingomonas sp. QA11 TaxID=2950605 RepID=UPI00234B254A|nr:winged helix-turn-helix domain-containing protein [Sphingomonas sp. QA11]WCM26607.1 winged helix-turn-helix domain-containing protein [Sphingomonas sp. QA11]
MKDGPSIAAIAALIGDPARANMLTALMDGRALTVSELAQAAGVGLPTASGHLAKLDAAGLLVARRQGRHRYFQLSGADVGEALESLMSLAARTGAMRVRTGPNDAALREARICYDHLAGERAVALMQAFTRNGLIAGEDSPVVTPAGAGFLGGLGIDVVRLGRARRPLCRACLDWSERRSHLGGVLGAAILDHVIAAGWARRGEGRAIRFDRAGAAAFDAAFLGG